MIRKLLFVLCAALTFVFPLVPFALAQTFSVLYTFSANTDGANPMGGVVLDAAGNIYGTTFYGGTSSCVGGGGGCGTIFKLDATGNKTTLFDFTGKSSGIGPSGNLIPDSAGNLYGMATLGGQPCFGCGTVFKVDRSGNFQVLHDFTGRADGAEPINSNLVRDPAGNLYGVTFYGGGIGCSGTGCGTVFKIDSAGNESILHAFNGTDGANPTGGLIRDSQGNLYGVTEFGGTSNLGVVFKIDANNNFHVLYQFSGAANGEEPSGGLVRDSAGNLYGLAGGGGDPTCQLVGCGLVYKLDSAGTLVVLYTFHGADGQAPNGNLIRDAAGNLYGTTYYGGQYGDGTVFELDPFGNLSLLHEFSGLSDGSNPRAGVTRDAAMNIYGTAANGAYMGGRQCAGRGCGVVFKIAP